MRHDGRPLPFGTTRAAVFATVLLCVLSAGLATRASAATISEEQIVQIQRKWLDLLVTANWKQAAEMIAPDFLWIHPTGRVDTKQSRLDLLVKGPQPAWSSIETKDIRAAVFNDSAMVTSEVNWASALAAGETRQRVLHLRVTTVWVNQKGTWRVARLQATTFPPTTN